MNKFDVFVCSPKNNTDTTSIDIHVKLMFMFDARLQCKGFSNTYVESMWNMAIPELSDEELAILATNPMFISEHWLSKSLMMDSRQEEKMSVFKAPWVMRPNISEYHYADRGQIPKLHTAFVGCHNSGKTWLINEFKQMLKEIVPPIQIIMCANPITDSCNFCVTTDSDFMRQYFENIHDNVICLGNGPSFRINLDNQLEHNTRV